MAKEIKVGKLYKNIRGKGVCNVVCITGKRLYQSIVAESYYYTFSYVDDPDGKYERREEYMLKDFTEVE
jgi:hypothetical protein